MDISVIAKVKQLKAFAQNINASLTTLMVNRPSCPIQFISNIRVPLIYNIQSFLEEEGMPVLLSTTESLLFLYL